jgi:hypothetical protein
MRSPFPGMDPYIEACHLWEDFHHDLISDIKNALAPILPKRYVVRTGERAYVTLTAKNGVDEYRMQADVTVARKPGGDLPAGQAAALLEAADPASTPVTMRALVQTEFREGFLEIREAHGERQVVTSLEVLSPANKRFGSEGWFEYLRKRQACLSGLVNFVEIDLLRGGRRMPMDDEWPDSPYYLLACRKDQAPRCMVWPAGFKRPLPPLVIPLLPPDPDVTVPLQPLIETIYARSQYELDIDYRQPLRPALSPVDQAWLEEQLRPQAPP